jgi:pentose-5-phosphate-3-epimerase
MYNTHYTHNVTQDIDVHLMVQPVDKLIEDFAKAGKRIGPPPLP